MPRPFAFYPGRPEGIGLMYSNARPQGWITGTLNVYALNVYKRPCPIELSTMYPPHLRKMRLTNANDLRYVQRLGSTNRNVKALLDSRFNDFHDLPKTSRPCASIYTLCPPHPAQGVNCL